MRNANGCTQRGASIRIAGTLSVLALTFVPVSAAAPDGARAAAMEAFRAGRGVAARTDGRWHLLPSRPATAATRASSPGSPSATLLFQRPNQADAQLSDIECDLCGGFNQAIAENFVVSNGGAGATVGSATFWGVYAFNNTAPPSDSFTVILHNDLAGLPGTTRCTFGPLSPTRVATGVIATGQNLDEYMYTVTLPGGCFLPDGTYWIEIFDDTTVDPDDDDWFWETGIQDFARGLPDFALASEAPGVNWTSSAGADEELSLVLVDASSTCREPALAIPDNNAGGVNDTLSVAAGGIITDVNVSIVATHTRVGDLDFRLTHVPTGTQVIILDRPGVPPAPGCAGNDMDVVLDDAAAQQVETQCAGTDPTILGTFRPNNPLSAFNGLDSTGNWTLRARDLNTGEVGTLDQWCLLFTYCPNITVNPGSPLPPGTTGTPYSATFTGSGGTAPYTFTVTAGALPPGLALNGATGVLSGTPTAQGTYNFTIRATDVNGCFGARAYTLVISCGTITLAPAALPNGTLGVPYSQTITASGGTPPYTFAVTGGTLPTGLALSAGGVLSGTPTAAGTFNFQVTATDASGCTGGRQYSVVINCATITVSPSSLPAGTVGTPYSQTVTASGGTPPYTFAVTAGSLPPGLALNGATGVISGTPTTSGTFNFTITATDAASCTGSRAYALVINPSGCGTITLSPPTLPNGTVGVPYSQTVTASGGTAPYTYAVTAGALPPGLALNGATGVISGTPTTSGTFNFTITATDAGSCTGSLAYTVTINPSGCGTITISPATLPNAVLGMLYSQTLTASGGTAPYTFAVTAGALPAGLTLSAAGVISGTPQVTGPFNCTITATDSASCTGSQIYTLTVVAISDYVVGQGDGQPNANRVRVYTPAGTPTSVDFLAYAAGQWGVNVASGNVNGPIFDEILTGPGPGPVFGPQVRGWDRAGTPLAKINYYAYGTLKFGVNVGSADVENDAFDEILTGAGPGPVFGPHVRGWNYDNVTLTAIAKISFFAYGTLKYGVNVTGGSVDADAFDEIGTGPGPGVIFGPQMRGWNYDGANITAISKVNFNAFAGLTYGLNLAWGDVDGDGFDELIATPGPGPTNPSRFVGYDYDGTTISALPGFDITPFTTMYGGRVGAGDLLGDLSEDLIAGAGPNSVATSETQGYDYTGSALVLVPPTFVPFTGGYGVNVSGGILGY